MRDLVEFAPRVWFGPLREYVSYAWSVSNTIFG